MSIGTRMYAQWMGGMAWVEALVLRARVCGDHSGEDRGVMVGRDKGDEDKRGPPRRRKKDAAGSRRGLRGTCSPRGVVLCV